MTFKQIKENKLIKFITNRYILILSIFIVWMLFFDENSYLVHREYNKEIDKINKVNKFYEEKIRESNKVIKSLKDSSLLEKFAREQYLMKKENEDIYIIEFDTIKE